MKQILYASVIALGCTIAASAQGTMAGQTMAKDAKMAKDAAKSVKVTGCVAESDGHYMLNNATMADMAGSPMTYALSGGTLKPHVGHKVDITGTVKPAAKETMKKEGAAAKEGMAKDKMPAHDMASHDMATGGTLTVTKLDMVAPTCS